MIDFSSYSKKYNKYCVCYFGSSDEYLVQLRLLKPIIERQFPGLSITIGCRRDRKHIIDEAVLELEEIKLKRSDYAYLRELKFNGFDHPVEAFLKESDINRFVVCDAYNEPQTNRFVIITKGNYPTTDITNSQMSDLHEIAKEMSLVPEINGSTRGAGIVAGVESVPLFEAAAKGIPTILVPNGVGARLYKGMFPNGTVMST